jgi:hypothetical protein
MSKGQGIGTENKTREEKGKSNQIAEMVRGEERNETRNETRTKGKRVFRTKNGKSPEFSTISRVGIR